MSTLENENRRIEWSIRVTQFHHDPKIASITFFPDVDGVYQADEGIRTTVPLDEPLPFEEFWFGCDPHSISPTAVGGQALPADLVNALKDCRALYAHRHPLSPAGMAPFDPWASFGRPTWADIAAMVAEPVLD